MRYEVIFAPEAEQQLLELYSWIANASSHEIAARYTDAVVSSCENLAMFPQRGVVRDDIRPNLRVTHYRGRTVIAFTVHAGRVEILGIFHGGRDYAAFLNAD